MIAEKELQQAPTEATVLLSRLCLLIIMLCGVGFFLYLVRLGAKTSESETSKYKKDCLAFLESRDAEVKALLKNLEDSSFMPEVKSGGSRIKKIIHFPSKVILDKKLIKEKGWNINRFAFIIDNSWFDETFLNKIIEGFEEQGMIVTYYEVKMIPTPKDFRGITRNLHLTAAKESKIQITCFIHPKSSFQKR